MADDKKPIQLGFSSGQVLSLKLEPAEADKLINAIEAREGGWHTVSDDTRKLVLRASEVDYYVTEDKPDARRAGF